jgi:GntR family transcriptional repressor for pyruvate dehydrogenase complex
MFEAVKRGGSLVDVVVEQIQGLLARGELQSGDRLPREDELVDQFGVSRTVLREALGRLQAIGMLTVRRGQGMFVGKPAGVASCARMVRSALSLTTKDLVKFAEFRAAIESFAARRAAELATEEDLKDLEALCQEMNRPDQDHLASIKLDFRFHLRLVDIARNEVLHNALEVIQEFTMAAMMKTTPKPRDYGPSRALHMKIVDAIRSKDPDRAEREARIHVSLLEDGLEKPAPAPEAAPRRKGKASS